MKKHNGLLLSIKTSFPTVKGTPKKGEAAFFEEIRTSTDVGWPDNWHALPPQWKANILARLIHKIVGSFLLESKDSTATFKEFQRLTGWGSGEATKPRKNR